MEQRQQYHSTLEDLIPQPPHFSTEPKVLYSLNSYQMSLEKKLIDQLNADSLSDLKRKKRKKSKSKENKLTLEEEKPSYLRKTPSQSRKNSQHNEVTKKNSLTRYYGRIKGQNTESTMCSAQEMQNTKFFYTPESMQHSEVIKSKRPASGRRSTLQKQQVFLKRQLTAKMASPRKKTLLLEKEDILKELPVAKNKSNISVVDVYEKRGSPRADSKPKGQREARNSIVKRGSKYTPLRTPCEERIKRLSSQFSQSNTSQICDKMNGNKTTIRIKKLNKNHDWPYLDTSISNIAILEASPISKELIREYRRTVDSFRTPKGSTQRKNPVNVNKILNLQLSASTMASHKWGSQTTKSRISAYHVTSPSVDETRGEREKSQKLYSSVRASIKAEDREDVYLSNKCINHQIYNEKEKAKNKTINLSNYSESKRIISPSLYQSLKDDTLPDEEKGKLRNVLNLKEREKMLDSFIKKVQRAQTREKVIFGRKWSQYACQEKLLYEILKKKEREKKKDEKQRLIKEREIQLEQEKEKQKEQMKAEFMGHSRQMSVLSSSPNKVRRIPREELRFLFATTPQKVPNSGLQKV